MNVIHDDDPFESVRTSCFFFPDGSSSCNPIRIKGDPQVVTSLPSCFGTFTFGPHDFTYGQPFDIEVRVQVGTTLRAGLNTQGMASAQADLSSTVTFVGVQEVFDGPGGTGTSLPLQNVVASTASGSDWLQTVPEPSADLQRVAALLVLGIAAIGRIRRAPR